MHEREAVPLERVEVLIHLGEHADVVEKHDRRRALTQKASPRLVVVRDRIRGVQAVDVQNVDVLDLDSGLLSYSGLLSWPREVS